MNRFHNKHLKQTCFILGNGPSLNKVSSHLLSLHPTFGTNRIYLKFVPNYYVCVNPLVIEQNANDIDNIVCEAKFIPQKLSHFLKSNDDVFLLNRKSKKEFSLCPDEWIYEGYTVTFVCLQLAYYMGFEVVYLVGVDHRYEFEGKPNDISIMKDDDPNHFDPEYFKGQKWNNPDLEQSEYSYQLAKEAFEKDGRKIFNATPNSALNVFDKVDIRYIY